MAHEIIMPALGMAQETGRLVAWLKNEGDAVSKGEPLMEVETDKSTMEVEAPKDGFLIKIAALAHTDVPVGEVVAYIVENLDDVPVELAKTSSVTSKQEEIAAEETQNQATNQAGTDKAIRLTEPANNSDKIKTDEKISSSLTGVNLNTKILASPKLRSLAKNKNLFVLINFLFLLIKISVFFDETLNIGINSLIKNFFFSDITSIVIVISFNF